MIYTILETRFPLFRVLDILWHTLKPNIIGNDKTNRQIGSNRNQILGDAFVMCHHLASQSLLGRSGQWPMANRFKPAPSGPWALFLRLVRSLCWDQAPLLFFRATLWDMCHSWTSMQSLSIEHGQEVASKTTEMLETDETAFMNEYVHEEPVSLRNQFMNHNGCALSTLSTWMH